jgi:hypothetical protein
MRRTAAGTRVAERDPPTDASGIASSADGTRLPTSLFGISSLLTGAAPTPPELSSIADGDAARFDATLLEATARLDDRAERTPADGDRDDPADPSSDEGHASSLEPSALADAAPDDASDDESTASIDSMLALLAGALPTAPESPVAPRVEPVVALPAGLVTDLVGSASDATPIATSVAPAVATGTFGDSTVASDQISSSVAAAAMDAADGPEHAVGGEASGEPHDADGGFAFLETAVGAVAGDDFSATADAGSAFRHGGSELDPLATPANDGNAASPAGSLPTPIAERLLNELAGTRGPAPVEAIGSAAGLEVATGATSTPRTLPELPDLLGAARDGVVRLHRDGARFEAEIRLDPAELGAIHVRIESYGGRLHIDARCDDRDVERELANLFSQWNDDLRKQGGGASFAFDRSADGEASRDGVRTAAAERSAAAPAPARGAGGAGPEEARQLDLLA